MMLLRIVGKLIPLGVVAVLAVTHAATVVSAAEEILTAAEGMVACVEERSRLAEAIADGHDDASADTRRVRVPSGVAVSSVRHGSGERCGTEGPRTVVTFTDGSVAEVPGHAYLTRVEDGVAHLRTR